MKKVLLLALAGASFALSSCSITLPVAVSSNPIGSKVGSSTATVFLGVLSFGGDASIQAAAKKGGITRVSTVDMKQSNILFIYQQFTTMVTGE
ncbi:TRL-like family protein [Hymenobacter negativus]|uniref:TRL-like family protein n=1 Tax=Hymenobacter negativus TaxID=2795026 RepID=A0ABS3QJF3_9BACT|nr:TRL-like family protein [Hymenobacter negativus]MBO2011359.1 TRL-like family protein [Hymenobacter negativus]